ncbi:membrane protein [Streptomyces albireticuli]|uniref:Membrane protein n=1 Tax=Streptomyces albireticuli TaxID=1940 RepID=A0A1Z2L779_9ACTN|nr:membrane protein [Streptomyces albireticuli]
MGARAGVVDEDEGRVAAPAGVPPVDLRLAVPAAAAWAAAAWALTAGERIVLTLAAVAVVGACGLVLRAWWSRRPVEGASPAGSGRAGAAVALAAVLLCAVAGAVAGTLRAADTRRGPLPELARQYGEATVDLTVTADPRAARPHVRGAARAAPAALVEAEATRVVTSRGAARVRTPVLVIADPSWLGLLPPPGSGWREGSPRPPARATAPPPSYGPRARDRPGSSSGPPRSSAPPAGSARDCGRPRTVWTRTRGRSSPDWSSATPPVSRRTSKTPSGPRI